LIEKEAIIGGTRYTIYKQRERDIESAKSEL
jgi:hypothetical protein